jgi:hypothetical protein
MLSPAATRRSRHENDQADGASKEDLPGRQRIAYSYKAGRELFYGTLMAQEKIPWLLLAADTLVVVIEWLKPARPA